MNVWQNFYQNVRDSSWPDCINETEFSNLPKHIQTEILTVHNGEQYLKLSESDIIHLPIENNLLVTTSDDCLLEFSVASDFVVYYTHHVEGGGIHFGQNYPRVLRYLYPNRIFEHSMEWCAGAGHIGFRLLADGICNHMHFVEIDNTAVEVCRKTIADMPARFYNKVSITHTATLADVDDSLMFDLIVANPPSLSAVTWIPTLFENSPDNQWQRLTVDRDWAAHQDFFKHAKQHLKENGVILLQENTSVYEFTEFIDSAGLRVVRAFTEKFCPRPWYLELAHK